MNSSDSNEDFSPPGPFDHRTLDRLLSKAKVQASKPAAHVHLDEARRPVVAQPQLAPSRQQGSIAPSKNEPDGTWAERMEVWIAWTAMCAVVLTVAYIVYAALVTWKLPS